MKISLQLSSIGLRAVLFGAILILCVGLMGIELQRFITSVVASSGIEVDLPTLKFAADSFPHSARLQARLAARMIESQSDNQQSHEALSESAFQHANRAVELAPANYEYRVLLSAAAELKGDLSGAESALREAVRLASNNVQVRWQMANLFLRLGKLEESLNEFRFVTEAEPRRLPNVLNMLWKATDGNLAMLERVTGNNSLARLHYAGFLVEQQLFEAAAQSFSQSDRNIRLQSPETGKILDALLKAGQWQWTESLWRDTIANATSDNSPFWNGGFEHISRKGLTQFDWQLNNSGYARLAIQPGGRADQKALRLAYMGVDTTRLDREVQHLAVLQPGRAYRLECFAKPEKLVVTDEAPQVAILRADNRELIASSAAVSAAVTDWQMLTADFVVPSDLPAVIVTIRQIPRYRYTEPTRGVIWFDDFSLKAR